jgi:hypothetical protein
MRGRPPQLIELSTEDAAYLEQLLRDGRPSNVLHGARTTIWNICRRCEEVVVQVVEDAPRVQRSAAEGHLLHWRI